MNLYINCSNRKENCYKILNEMKSDEDILISLCDKNINYCKGCTKCTKGLENYCAQKDDMIELYKLIAKSNEIIIASPIYMNFISGRLKCVIERLQPYIKQDDLLNKKKIKLIITGSLSEKENEEIIKSINDYFMSLSEFMKFDFEFIKYVQIVNN